MAIVEQLSFTAPDTITVGLPTSPVAEQPASHQPHVAAIRATIAGLKPVEEPTPPAAVNADDVETLLVRTPDDALRPGAIEKGPTDSYLSYLEAKDPAAAKKPLRSIGKVRAL